MATKQRPAFEVEGARGVLAQPRPNTGRGALRPFDRHRVVLVDHLQGDAVLAAERGTQGLVTFDDSRDAPYERVAVEHTGQAHRLDDVVERVLRLELVHEPQPLLG